MSLPITHGKNNMKIDLKQYHDSHNKETEFGQAGVLHKIFKTIGTTNKYFVEFGSEGTPTGQGNSYCLRKLGFEGLLMDARQHLNKAIFEVKTEFIYSNNINKLFEKYQVPNSFDFLSIDIDNNDFHVWYNLSEKYVPRVVSIETSACFPKHLDIVLPEQMKPICPQPHSGSSALAIYNLGRYKGYSYVTHCGVDAIFIHDSIIQEYNVEWVDINNFNNIHPGPIHKIYTPKKYLTSKNIICN